MSATDTTYELLRAPWVKTRLRLQTTSEGLQRQVDGDTTFVDVNDGDAFVLSEQRDVVFRDFNPFLYTIKTEEKTEKDVNFASIATLLDAIQKASMSIAGTPQEQMQLGLPQPGTLSTMIDRVEQQEATPGAAAGCAVYENLHKDLVALYRAVADPVVTAADFDQWVNSATTQSKVADLRKQLAFAIETLQTKIGDVDRLDRAIAKTYISSSDKAKTEDACSTFHAETFALVYELARRLDVLQQARRQLLADLTKVNESLAPFADKSRWREDTPTDYIIYKPTPSLENVKVLTVAVTPRAFALADGKLTVTEGKTIARSIRLRQHSFIVPEASAAIVHTDLRYPKYGTQQVGGQTVVASAGFDDFPASATIAINAVCRCWGPTFVYPAVQFGVTNTKDYPGFVLGGGARFTYPRPLSIVGGWLFTWFRDLDGISVGQAVNGTAELESHLRRKRAPTATYVGIQYSF